ncbi:radical SAM protein [bacterium]|nr:radical SAM protein [bacterium]
MPKYKSCHSIEGELFFNHLNKIGYCSMLTPNGGQPTLYENYTGEIINWDEFFEKRDADIELIKNNSCPTACNGCLWIKEFDWEERKKEFRYILINIWVKCNLKCIYCSNHKDTYVIENTKPYNIVPVLKDMIEKGFITENTKIDIAGGESTLDPHFNELIELLIESKIKNININTNAVNYSDAITNGIKKGFVSIITSVDAGNAKSFEYIKKANQFKNVWQHLKLYAKAKENSNSNTVRAKYIVIPTINDTKREIKSFLLKAKKMGVQGVIYSTDLHWVLHNPNDKKTMIKTINLAKYFIKISTLLNLNWQIWAHVEDLIKRYNLIEEKNKIDIDFIFNKELYKNEDFPILKFLLNLQSKIA